MDPKFGLSLLAVNCDNIMVYIMALIYNGLSRLLQVTASDMNMKEEGGVPKNHAPNHGT
jgi:hypothetical protein